ncbi:caspase family protein [Rhodobacteraceae bacterium N5(2021)]|uniref:Caspase family protein n=1 Tax=Gymnodinialimonas phycosphaerae TaxID=2841589 RepID=A0A975TW59_9RHOB|nr:caspase family protein [Gymnodinialimonas phycosphaerae]MBY4892024.1 caspase family protein [Gymnodinialimonas phycosphaerae]
MKTFIWVLVWFVGLASVVSAQDRHALVIGIDDYVNVSDLQKARNDAEAVGVALEDTGFDVTVLLDANRRDMFRALNTFVGQLQPGDDAVFYFAGHGVEVEGRNYLLPTDVPAMRPGEERLLTSESLAADDVLADMQASGARVSLLILDACRDNPFPTEGTRSLGRSTGLSRLEAPEGAFIMFSAGTGQAALDRLSDDDPNPNSVFTRALLPLLSEPGLPIHQIARRLRRDVQDLASSVGYSQRPAYYDEVTGDFFFLLEEETVEGVATGTPGPTPTPTQPPASTQPQAPASAPDGVPERTPSTTPCATARLDWALVADSSSPAVLEAYLASHQDCAFMVALASERLATLQAPPPDPCAPARAEWEALSARPDFDTAAALGALTAFQATYGTCPIYGALVIFQFAEMERLEDERRRPVHGPRPSQGNRVCTTSTGFTGPGVGARTFCASSALPPAGTNSYWPPHLFDDNLRTAWNEGVSGRGRGQTLAWEFEAETQVRRIRVVNGYTKTNRTYTRNARVREVRITGSSGFSMNTKLRDTGDWQTIELGDIDPQMWLQIGIVSTYPGTHYADTEVTELRIE